MDRERPGVAAQFSRLSPLALSAALAVVYAPSLDGNFLNWDDNWLVERSPLVQDGSLKTLGAIWTDLSFQTRYALGAEYLPVRDMVQFVEARLFGAHPLPLRLVQLGLYIAAVLVLRRALLGTLGNALSAEIATWTFALHPVHVESVAWLSGLKDVLGLLFVALALAAHAGERRSRRWLVPLLLLCAHFSKSMTVVAGGLLVAEDLMLRRRLDPVIYGLTAVVAVIALIFHIRVGAVVRMTGAPAGGNHLTALMTMGPVWLRYLWVTVWPGALSLVHDVVPRTAWSAKALAGYGVILGWGIAAVWFRVRRNRVLPLVAWIWFWVPLLPVSQVLFPLQNLMADRYLCFSVMALGLALSGWFEHQRRLAGGVACGFVVLFAGATLYRSTLFSSSSAVFADATLKTRDSPVAPYQLGMALQEAGDTDAARDAFEEVLRRGTRDMTANTVRRATNNLAKIYVKEGRLSEAESLLRRGVTIWPRDGKMLRNLLRVFAKEGKDREAHEVDAQLRMRDDSNDYPD